MIAFLRGTIKHKNINSLILEVGDVGYQVFASEALLSDLKLGSSAELYVHHHVREEAADLYGFKSAEDLELFELLLTVSGIGPKSALGILALASAGDIKEAIIRGDANLLTKVSGIGKKTAERLVLELKSKVIRAGGTAVTINSGTLGGGDEIDALMSLGYSLGEARSALAQVDPEIADSGERVKSALKMMKK